MSSRLFPPPLDALAQRQFGLLRRDQLLGVLSKSQVGRLLDAGVLVLVRPGVYRLAGVPVTWRQRALAACLAVGGTVALSHLTAGHAWRVSCLAPSAMEVSVPPERRVQPQDLIVHRRPLPACDLVERWGIPVTAAPRTIIDLSTVLARPLLARVADELLRRRVLDISQLGARLDRDEPLPRFTRGDVEDIVWRHRDGGVGASPREDWAFDTLVGAGLPPPARHHMVTVGGQIRELDCAYPELRIGIDYDGWSAHRDVAHFHGDRDRQAAFQLEGWILFQVTLEWTADLLVARVSAAIDQRGAGMARPSGRMIR